MIEMFRTKARIEQNTAGGHSKWLLEPPKIAKPTFFPWLWMQMAPAFGLYKAGTRANSCMNLFEWTHERPKTTKRPTFSKPHSGVV